MLLVEKRLCVPRPLVEGAQADRPEQRKARIEVGLRDADAGALRGGGHLGAADVGPPPQHLGGHADRHLGGRLRISLGPAEQRLDGARSAARAAWLSALRACCSAGLQLRDRGPRALEQRRRLGRVQLRGRAVLEPRLRDPQRLLLDPGVLLGLPDQHLEGADRRRTCAPPPPSATPAPPDSRPPRRAGRPPPLPRRAGTCPRSPAPTRRRSRLVARRRCRLMPTMLATCSVSPIAVAFANSACVCGNCRPVAMPNWARASTMRSPAICSGRFCR